MITSWYRAVGTKRFFIAMALTGVMVTMIVLFIALPIALTKPPGKHYSTHFFSY